MARSRGYTYTLNNWTEEEYNDILKIDCAYHIVGKEIAPETGTKHLQGYIYFKEKKSLKQVKAGIPRAHLEGAQGNAEQNYKYCSKGGDYVEVGTRPRQGKRNDLLAVRDAIKDNHGSIKEGIDEGIITGYQAVKVYKELLPYYEPRRSVKPEVIYIWGESGTGKSEMARQLAGDNYYEKHGDSGKWWDGYDGELTIVLDELRGSSFAFTMLLGILLGPCRVECKGGSRQLQATKIIVTSIYPPDRLYKFADLGDEPLKQLLRRISKVIMTEYDPDYKCPNVICPEVGGNTDPDLFSGFYM